MERTARKSHARKVYECYVAMKDGKSFARFGKKTRDDAFQMLKENSAKKMGMTLEEYEKWLWEDDEEEQA